MKLQNSFYFALIIFVLLQTACNKAPEDIVERIVTIPLEIKTLDNDKAAVLAASIKDEVNITVADGLEMNLWAVDSLVEDPIAISVAPDGKIYYTSGSRQSNSEFDIRGHRNWMTASISFQTVEDRRAFLKKTFSEDNEEGKKFLKDLNQDGTLDWRDLAVQKEQIWFVEDESGNGIADKTQLYLEDYNEEITDVANGIEFHDGEVFIAVGPDIWKTKDLNKDGSANVSQSLSHGYAVHIGFSGHGMSGAIIGPDGRLWWGIGDIGANVVDQSGKRWKYPNRGVIARCELDGSGFEIYCMGVRNTHEFVFDQYGNLISEDNDGDHEGERERLVYLINGSDTGWRINWQFGKYTDPDNNTYKVWTDEKMHVPHWEGQAAYILPAITNYVNGPTGFTYNPGTALGEKYYNHFFVSEFRGSSANSPIHAFTLKPSGASFELEKTEEIVKGILPTGLDFGPDGALYVGDWIEGWGTKDNGRIWKIDVPNGASSAIRKATKKLIQTNFKTVTISDLNEHLGHQDMRIRQKAQFELVKRRGKGFEVLKSAATSANSQLKRIHGLWGMAQMSRSQNPNYITAIVPYVKDTDDEIAAQAAKMLGDVKYKGKDAGKVITDVLLTHSSLRVQLLATEALGRMEYEPAVRAILAMLEKNNDTDKWLRHAGAIALSRIAGTEGLASMVDHPSDAVRMAVVIALRRQEAANVGLFLKDKNELIATEAARAINDDFSIEEALSDLADILNTTPFTNEALIRRAINANLRVGQTGNLNNLIAYAQKNTASPAMRAEAVAAVSTWAKPSVFDRVDGRYRGVITRKLAPVQAAIQPILGDLLGNKNEVIQTAAIKATAKLQLESFQETLMALLQKNRSATVRTASLEALNQLNVKDLDEALTIALADKNQLVRSKGLALLPKSNIEENIAVDLFESVLKKGTIQEQQSVLKALGQLKGEHAVKLLGQQLTLLTTGKAKYTLHLDIIESLEEQENTKNLERLQSYLKEQTKTDPLAEYRSTLVGGDREKGRHIFYNHEAAQCVRCHAVFEYGGNAGPALAGVGSRLTKEEFLKALIEPSASFAAGYEVVTLTLKDKSTLTGIVLSETNKKISLKIGKAKIESVDKATIEERTTIPSSMPNMKPILSKREVRDLVAFLGGLKRES